MKKRRNKGNVKVDPDLDRDVENYKMSDSDDGFTNEDKILLERSKHGRYRQNDDSEEEVLKVHSSSEDEDAGDSDGEEDGEKEAGYYGGGLDSDYDSDVEGKAGSKRDENDGLPDDKAWGSSRSKFYNTDYVDQDYGGFGKDEEEVALMEEKEADTIQRRLMSQLEETDFTLGLLDQVEQKKTELAEKSASAFERETITTDFTKLSTDEKVQFLKKESPEFFPLIDDFKTRLKFARDKIVPVLELVESGEVPDCRAAQCLRLQYKIIMQYCTNIAYYLFAKSQRVRLDNHPVIGRLYKFRKLLQELDIVNEEVLIEQVDCILESKRSGSGLTVVEQPPEPEPKNRRERRLKKLKILEAKQELERRIEEKKRKFEERADSGEEAAAIGRVGASGSTKKRKQVTFQEEEEESSDQQEDEQASEFAESEDNDDDLKKTSKSDASALDKRGINFKIAKNKGLTPKRKKEQRNPRVKHRNKFKKAKIRRKGQVREVRKEINKYSGEISGIKAYVSKSIKLK